MVDYNPPDNSNNQRPRALGQPRRPQDIPLGAAIGQEEAFGVGFADTGEPKSRAKAIRLSSLLRFKWTALIVFLLIACPAIAAIWIFIVPLYLGEGEVRVRPIIPRLVFATEDNGMIPLYKSYMNTQVAVMLNPVVLENVLARKDVRNTFWYSHPESSPLGGTLKPIERLKKSLVVMPRPQTEIIGVSMMATHPNDAAVIVNAVLDEYIKYINERSDKTNDTIYRRLKQEYGSLRKDIEERQRITARLRKELMTSTPDELVSRKRVRLDILSGELDSLQREIAVALWQKKALESLIKKDNSAKTKSKDDRIDVKYEYDPEWRKLYMNLKQLEHQLAIEETTYGQAHPKIIALHKKIEFAKELMHMRQVQLEREKGTPLGSMKTAPKEGTNVMFDIEILDRKLKLLRYKEKLLKQAIREQRKQFEQTFSRSQILAQEVEDMQHKKELYSAVRKRLDYKEMERNVPGSIEILARAFPASEPTKDRRFIFTILALMLAIAGGVSVAYLRAVTTQNIYEIEDVAETVPTRFLGQLPIIQQSRGLLIEDNPLISEKVRMVRTALLECIDGEKGVSIQITSPTQGAGKTTFTMLLARSLANCGKKVLLVDADLRNPNIADRLNIDNEPGLVYALSLDNNQNADPIRKTDIPGLDVIPAGNAERDDLEKLAVGTFPVCLKRWRKSNYDIILIDSSPVLPVADARIISGYVDATIMIIREGITHRIDVIDALSCLDAAGGNILGTIFMGSGRRAGYGYGYGYGRHYYPNYAPIPPSPMGLNWQGNFRRRQNPEEE